MEYSEASKLIGATILIFRGHLKLLAKSQAKMPRPLLVAPPPPSLTNSKHRRKPKKQKPDSFPFLFPLLGVQFGPAIARACS